MDRTDLELWEKCKTAVEDYGLDYLLEVNELEYVDVVFQLVKLYGLELPE